MTFVPDEHLIKQFTELLDAPPPPGRQKEQVVQDFLEDHTELIPTPNLLNHRLNFQAVISKFPLGTEFITDFVYLTKSSDTWRITLVELEKPEKKFFNSRTDQVINSAGFNAAMSQIRDWQCFLDENKSEVIRRLTPLMQPPGFRSNPIIFDFMLIFGRSADKNLTDQRKKHISRLRQDTGFYIYSYDSLISEYRNSPQPPESKNIIKLTGSQYQFEKLHIDPPIMFAYMSPGELNLSSAIRSDLIQRGYDIPSWEGGQYLSLNGKQLPSATPLLGKTPPTP